MRRDDVHNQKLMHKTLLRASLSSRRSLGRHIFLDDRPNAGGLGSLLGGPPRLAVGAHLAQDVHHHAPSGVLRPRHRDVQS